ncbi:hypothetical protein KQX54_015002 [Cotesia glomerata]|uniref:Uncharacterized protein n=1 Tax=Cotesia glomerata TaxID=32391 RepID=A0AAV7HV18_COTGL|nr:hypothetical protein KQX54_015002 [Cotesia glomerata]
MKYIIQSPSSQQRQPRVVGEVPQNRGGGRTTEWRAPRIFPLYQNQRVKTRRTTVELHCDPRSRRRRTEPRRTNQRIQQQSQQRATTRINGGIQQRRSAGNQESTRPKSRIWKASIAGTVTKSGDRKPRPGVGAASTTKSSKRNSYCDLNPEVTESNIGSAPSGDFNSAIKARTSKIRQAIKLVNMAATRINKKNSEQIRIQKQALENAVNLKKRLADQKANNLSKKHATSQKQAPTATILTANRFSPLYSNEDDDDEILEYMDFTETNEPEKQQKTVPIVINTSTMQQSKIKTMIEEIHAISNSATVKFARESITIYTADQTSYQVIKDYLTTRAIQDHTYTQKGSKENKLVIKGLPAISTEQIAIKLTDPGHRNQKSIADEDCQKCINQRRQRSTQKPKRPLPAAPTYNEHNFPDLPRKNQHPP